MQTIHSTLFQPTAPLSQSEIDNLPKNQQIDLLLTTTHTQEIDALQQLYAHALRIQPEVRTALYQIARQNAQHRRRLSPGAPLPSIDIFMLPLSDGLSLLKETLDVELVDSIEQWTEGRLRKLPDYRTGLFDIARQGVAYRMRSYMILTGDGGRVAKDGGNWSCYSAIVAGSRILDNRREQSIPYQNELILLEFWDAIRP